MTDTHNKLLRRSYGVLLADPPWTFKTYSDKGQGKSPSKHYPYMPLFEIHGLRRKLEFDEVLARDCVCVLWATFPRLPDALTTLDAWGFKYKTGGAWGKLTRSGKPAFGTGFIYRSAAELWILGTRGKPDINNHSVRNLILAERREHSRKPDEMQDNLERLFSGPYLELFARRHRPGWDVWGNEV